MSSNNSIVYQRSHELLFDYAYPGKGKCEKPHMAILLPEKPDFPTLEWLIPLNISITWQKGNTFLDNANGQFV